MKKILVIVCLAGFYSVCSAQNLVPERRTDWSTQFFTIPEDTLINAVDAGFMNDGSSDGSALFNAIMLAFPGKKIHIYFPAGTYLFQSTIYPRSYTRITGAGADSTFMKFDGGGNGHFIQITGNMLAGETPLTSHFSKDDVYVEVADTTALASTQFVKIIEDDDGRITSSWSSNMIGQLVEIDSISGNRIYFPTPLRMDFDTANHPRLVHYQMKTHVEISCLSIERLDATAGQTSNIYMDGTAFCMVSGIQSDKTNFAHVAVSNSYNIHVTNSYFHHAHAYGDGGQGYGVVLQFTTGNSLVQNNIFEHLRHSILLQACPNGNILAYNYSLDPNWSSFPSNSAGDIVLHGNWPFMNLMEGNTIQNIVIDDSHGLNGPFNTFYRNRAELYGIVMTSASDGQNFIGNEIPNTTIFMGLFSLAGSNHYSFGNNDGGTTVPIGTSNLTDTSLYLASANPYYSLYSSLPAIGYPNALNEQTILAQYHYNHTELSACEPIFTDTTMADTNTASVMEFTDIGIIYPNPTNGILCIQSEYPVTEAWLYSITGQCFYLPVNQQMINISGYRKGIYLLKINQRSFKIILL